MKLPFDLGVKLIFRLLVPGFLLTLGLYPTLATIREEAGWTISIEYLFILSTVVTGWLVVTLDQPIYMFLEGRRFWPRPLRAAFIWLERRRLQRLIHLDNKFYNLSELARGSEKPDYHQRYIEASVEERNFPLDSRGQPEARFPTRLGNLIDAYESYPLKRYGIEAVFYWYRIWLKLDKDLREELDTRQAMADSSIYASVALFISGLLWLSYSILLTLSPQSPILHIPKFGTIWIASGFLLLSYLMYRASLFPQAQYGESFKSVFDAFEKFIDVQRIVGRVAEITSSRAVLNESRSGQFMTAWRYLHNYKVKCPRPECSFRYSMSPEVLEEHNKAKHNGPKQETPVAPDFATYRSGVAAAYMIEKRVRWLKAVSLIFALALLAFGAYRNITLIIAAIMFNVLTYGVELWLRSGQKKGLDALNDFETAFEIPQIYAPFRTGLWRTTNVLLPHILTLALGLALLILWLTGSLSYT